MADLEPDAKADGAPTAPDSGGADQLSAAKVEQEHDSAVPNADGDSHQEHDVAQVEQSAGPSEPLAVGEEEMDDAATQDSQEDDHPGGNEEVLRKLVEGVVQSFQVQREKAETSQQLKEALANQEQVRRQVSELESQQQKLNEGKDRSFFVRLQQRQASAGGLLAGAAGFVALTAVVLLFGRQLEIASHTRWIVALGSGIVAWLLGVAAMSLPLFVDARKEQRQIEEDARNDVAASTNALQNAKDLVVLIKANRRQMAAYDVLAQAQAKTAFRNSQMAMAAGLAVLIGGAVIAISVNDVATKVATASLTAIGGALSGYIAKTFLDSYKGAMRQLNFYFQQPLITSYLLAVQRLVNELTEDKRDAALAETIARINEMLVRPWDNASGEELSINNEPEVNSAKVTSSGLSSTAASSHGDKDSGAKPADGGGAARKSKGTKAAK